MLCLTRNQGQSIKFTVAPSTEPTVITLKYVERRKSGTRITLGIEAPRSVEVLRDDAKADLPPDAKD